MIHFENLVTEFYKNYQLILHDLIKHWVIIIDQCYILVMHQTSLIIIITN